MSWLQIKKDRHFEVSSSLILCKNNEPLLSQIVMCTKKWTVYDNWQQPARSVWTKKYLVTTSSVFGPRSSSKALPKPNLHPKKRHGHCLVVCCHSDPLQLSESWRNHYVWEVGSPNQWDPPNTAMPVAALVKRGGPVLLHDHTSHIQCFKSWMNWAI